MEEKEVPFYKDKAYIIAFIILIFAIFNFVPWGIEENSSPTQNENDNTKLVSSAGDVENKDEEKTTDYVTLTAGEEGIILNDVLFALGNDKKIQKELMDYVTAEDTELVDQMILDGKVIVISANTPIQVIKNDLLSVQVKVLETGQVGWVPFEYVGNNK